MVLPSYASPQRGGGDRLSCGTSWINIMSVCMVLRVVKVGGGALGSGNMFFP